MVKFGIFNDIDVVMFVYFSGEVYIRSGKLYVMEVF